MTVPVLQFSRARMKRTADSLSQVLEQHNPFGFLAWLDGARIDVRHNLDDAESEVYAAVFAGDGRRFAAAIAKRASIHLQAVAVYEGELQRASRLTYSSPPLHKLFFQCSNRPVRLDRPAFTFLVGPGPAVPGTSNPRAQCAALTLLSPAAVFRAPAPPQGRDQTNGPDEGAA